MQFEVYKNISLSQNISGHVHLGQASAWSPNATDISFLDYRAPNHFLLLAVCILTEAIYKLMSHLQNMYSSFGLVEE